MSLARIADKVGLNYEPMRNLVRGNVKRPYFDVILRLHELSGHSMDEHFGLKTADRTDHGSQSRLLQQYQSRIDELELEKRLLLDWIRKYAMADGAPGDSTVVKFVNLDRDSFREPTAGQEAGTEPHGRDGGTAGSKTCPGHGQSGHEQECNCNSSSR